MWRFIIQTFHSTKFSPLFSCTVYIGSKQILGYVWDYDYLVKLSESLWMYNNKNRPVSWARWGGCTSLLIIDYHYYDKCFGFSQSLGSCFSLYITMFHNDHQLKQLSRAICPMYRCNIIHIICLYRCWSISHKSLNSWRNSPRRSLQHSQYVPHLWTTTTKTAASDRRRLLDTWSGFCLLLFVDSAVSISHAYFFLPHPLLLIEKKQLWSGKTLHIIYYIGVYIWQVIYMLDILYLCTYYLLAHILLQYTLCFSKIKLITDSNNG